MTPAVVQTQLRHAEPRITLGIYGQVIGNQQPEVVEHRSPGIKVFAVNDFNGCQTKFRRPECATEKQFILSAPAGRAFYPERSDGVAGPILTSAAQPQIALIPAEFKSGQAEARPT